MQHNQLKTFNFIIAGNPRPKDRPRTRVQKGKFGKSFVVFYNTKETENAENNISQSAYVAMKEQKIEMFETAISVDLIFYVPIPKSFSGIKTGRANAGDIVPVTKPDLDNYVKLVMDAMNKVVYNDDNLVVDIAAKKRYSDNTGTMVIVKEIEF